MTAANAPVGAALSAAGGFSATTNSLDGPAGPTLAPAVAEYPRVRTFFRLVVMADIVRWRANVRTFVVCGPDGTLLGKIELTSDGPAGKRYIARLINLEGGVEGRIFAGDDKADAHASIESAIENILEGAALYRERRAAVLH